MDTFLNLSMCAFTGILAILAVFFLCSIDNWGRRILDSVLWLIAVCFVLGVSIVVGFCLLHFLGLNPDLTWN